MKTFRARITPLLDHILANFTWLCLVFFNFRFKLLKPDERLKKLHNKYAGKRCFIVGLGPSLTIDDLNLLVQHGEYTFSMNRCYQLFDKTEWRPDCYFLSDAKVCTDETRKAVRGMLGDNRLVVYSKLEINGLPHKALYFKANFIDFVLRNSKKEKYRKRGHYCRLSTDASEYIYAGSSCIHSIIQLAYYMGFNKVYLLGTDCGSVNSKSYCNGLDNKQGATYSSDTSSLLIKDFESLKEDCDKKDLDFAIYNCSKGGILEVFKRIPLEDVLENKNV